MERILTIEEKNLTLRELIQKVNEELATNFAKEVISKGYNKYDTENGRKVIDISDVSRMIGRATNGNYNFYTQKFDIEMYDTNILLKTKRKKSGMTGYNHTDQLTVVEIFTENTDLLDISLETIYNDAIESKRKREQRKVEKKEEGKQIIIDTLKNADLSFKQFKSLMNLYSNLDWSQKQEIEDLMSE